MHSWRSKIVTSLALLGLATGGATAFYRDNGLRGELLARATKPLGNRVEAALFFPAFQPDERPNTRLSVALTAVARGLTAPTDIAFLPPPFHGMAVTEQDGRVTRVDPDTGATARWIDVKVHHDGDSHGLLGVAIHPKFPQNGRILLLYTVSENGKMDSLVSEYRVPNPQPDRDETPFFVRHILRVGLRPTESSGGQLRFGPDGMLYVTYGDGGEPGDPSDHGQDAKQWLGSILRLDVDGDAPPLAYRIPPDNPLRDRPDVAPETFAYGVRSPGGVSWDAAGHMIVADSGQKHWEELNFVLPGENLGWNRMEGRACAEDTACEPRGLRQPFRMVPHRQGTRIVGGAMSAANEPAALRGWFVYGDRDSGRLWAVQPPTDTNARSSTPRALGAWPIHPSAFGRDPAGHVYVADHARGVVFRLDAPPT